MALWRYQLFREIERANMIWQRFTANFNYLKRATTKLPFSNCFANSLNRLLSTQLINDGRVLVVQEDANDSHPLKPHAMKFPTIWLRDNCQCSECFHDTTKSRKINWERCNNIGARASKVTADDERNVIIIDWQDAHKSQYDLQWLRKRDFSPEQRKAYIEGVYKPKEIVWNKQQYGDILKIYDFQKIIAHDKGKVKALQQYGSVWVFRKPTKMVVTI